MSSEVPRPRTITAEQLKKIHPKVKLLSGVPAWSIPDNTVYTEPVIGLSSTVASEKWLNTLMAITTTSTTSSPLTSSPSVPVLSTTSPKPAIPAAPANSSDNINIEISVNAAGTSTTYCGDIMCTSQSKPVQQNKAEQALVIADGSNTTINVTDDHVTHTGVFVAGLLVAFIGIYTFYKMKECRRKGKPLREAKKQLKQVELQMKLQQAGMNGMFGSMPNLPMAAQGAPSFNPAGAMASAPPVQPQPTHMVMGRTPPIGGAAPPATVEEIAAAIRKQTESYPTLPSAAVGSTPALWTPSAVNSTTSAVDLMDKQK